SYCAVTERANCICAMSPTIMVMSSRGTQWFSAAALAAHSLSSSEFGASKSRSLEVLAVLLSFQVLFHLPRPPAGRAYRFTEFLLRDAEALLPIGNLIGLPDVDAGFIAVVSLFRRVDTSHQLLLSRALAV